jgi:hypothetical protein
MTDDERVFMHDIPVRELERTIASLEDHPQAHRATREQKVTTAYAAAIARVLVEQSELYLELLMFLWGDGDSFALLREEALDRARVIAELFLSARAEDVDIVEHGFPGQDPSGPLLILELIKTCDVLLTEEEPDDDALMTPDELDVFMQLPEMRKWLALTLPRGEEAPAPYGSGEELPAPLPADGAAARAAAKAIAELLDASAERYHSLIAATEPEPGAALAIAQAIARLSREHWRHNVDFNLLEPELRPTAAGAVLKAIGDSAIILAAPEGDFTRYGLTAAQLDDALAAADLRDWRAAAGGDEPPPPRAPRGWRRKP